jgi:hypothetical protein
VRGALLDSPDPAQRLAGLIVWRAIANQVFKSGQPDPSKPFAALSYAMVDRHDYTDLSCFVNARSTEIFFSADDRNLLAFVDRLLKFESDQEFLEGKSAAGYISLRFSERTAATIGPAQFIRTCAVECAALADEAGSTEFVDYAVQLALDPNIKGLLHWGQQNDSTQQDTEFRFGDAPGAPAGPLHDWRSVLSQLTDNGRLDAFSSAFTRRTGLEIVQPIVGAFVIAKEPTAADPSCQVAWDCRGNPPEAACSLGIATPFGRNERGRPAARRKPYVLRRRPRRICRGAHPEP